MSEQPTHQFPDPATDPLEAACQAMAICIAKQDGVALSPAGYRHGRAERPEAHRQMREYVQAGLDAAAAVRATLKAKGYAEPIAYVCEADIRELANKPDGTDMSIAPRPFPEYGMKFALYAEPQWPSDAVRSALSEMVNYYTATEDAELFQEEARLLENARAALGGDE